MNLSILPSSENVDVLKEGGRYYGNAFESLYLYERHLLENDLSKRALILIGTADNREIINKWENIDADDWFIVNSLQMLNSIPNNYFNVIVWSGCSLQDIFKNDQINAAYDKLISCGRIYVVNFAQDFKTILDQCLSPEEIGQIQGVYEKIANQVVSYPMKLTDGHLVIMKTPPKFEIDEELLTALRPQQLPAIMLTGYENYRSSCFMDSILFPMLIVPNNYFDSAFFKSEKCETKLEEIKMALYEQAMNMRNKRNMNLKCISILKHVKNAELKQLLTGGEQDDSEFLIALMNIFDLKPVATRFTRYMSNDLENWVKTSSTDEKTPVLEFKIPDDYDENVNIIEWMQREQITDFKDTPVNEWPRTDDNNMYRYIKETHEILPCEALIIHIGRKVMYDENQYKKIEDSVNFSEYIKNSDTNELLELTIVTNHEGSEEGGHYTSYFKYRGDWFMYNDTEPIERVSPTTWKNILRDTRTSNSLLVYEKMK